MTGQPLDVSLTAQAQATASVLGGMQATAAIKNSAGIFSIAWILLYGLSLYLEFGSPKSSKRLLKIVRFLNCLSFCIWELFVAYSRFWRHRCLFQFI